VVIVDCHFVAMSPLLHRVFTWFLLIVCFCFFFGLCLLVFSFALYFYGWIPVLDFYSHGFSSCIWFSIDVASLNESMKLGREYKSVCNLG
jgi:vacuolar-type H+-ATPase subunit I/STV1